MNRSIKFERLNFKSERLLKNSLKRALKDPYYFPFIHKSHLKDEENAKLHLTKVALAIRGLKIRGSKNILRSGSFSDSPEHSKHLLFSKTLLGTAYADLNNIKHTKELKVSSGALKDFEEAHSKSPDTSFLGILSVLNTGHSNLPKVVYTDPFVRLSAKGKNSKKFLNSLLKLISLSNKRPIYLRPEKIRIKLRKKYMKMFPENFSKKLPSILSKHSQFLRKEPPIHLLSDARIPPGIKYFEIKGRKYVSKPVDPARVKRPLRELEISSFLIKRKIHTPSPVGLVSSAGNHLILMEHVPDSIHFNDLYNLKKMEATFRKLGVKNVSEDFLLKKEAEARKSVKENLSRIEKMGVKLGEDVGRNILISFYRNYKGEIKPKVYFLDFEFSEVPKTTSRRAKSR